MLYLYPSVSGFLQMQSSLSKKLRFCAKLPTNRACGPVRRARRGVILNEKRGVYTLRAALSARLRSDTRLRAQSPPLFGGIRRVACTLLRKDAWLCHRQLFPRTLLFLLCLFRQSESRAHTRLFLVCRKPLARRVVQKKAFADHEDKKNSLC